MTLPNPETKEFIELLTERETNYYNKSISKTPFVSIISPFYNDHQYFEDTYKSVMNQSCQNFEWIMVDDCSTNSEAQALFKSLPQKSDKIKIYYHNENKGLAGCRNTAISYAKGKYLFFLDFSELDFSEQAFRR